MENEGSPIVNWTLKWISSILLVLLKQPTECKKPINGQSVRTQYPRTKPSFQIKAFLSEL